MRTVITLTGIRIQLPSNWAPIPLVQHSIRPITRPNFKKWLQALRNGKLEDFKTQTVKVHIL